jgi:hypothetical protein
MRSSPRTLGLLFFVLVSVAGCDDKKKSEPASRDPSAPPPPPTASATAGACNGGGGEIKDTVSAAFFPRAAGGYCVDPQGDVKTYGEAAKLTLDDVCTQEFDGECEVYKRYGLKRVVSLRYVDGAGKGGVVEIKLSRFADLPNAFAMFTKRVVADGDPARADGPKPLAAGGGGAMGTGTAYVWRGEHLVELSYLNESESQEQMAKSGAAILSVLGREIGAKLPGSTDKPASARALPEADILPNGVQLVVKDPNGWPNVGQGAIGFYKSGDKRWRGIAIERDDVDQAKDSFKTIKGRPGALPVAGLGDEAVSLTVPDTKAEWVVARMGKLVAGIGDEDLVKEASAKLSTADKTAKLKAWLEAAKVATPAKK